MLNIERLHKEAPEHKPRCRQTTGFAQALEEGPFICFRPAIRLTDWDGYRPEHIWDSVFCLQIVLQNFGEHFRRVITLLLQYDEDAKYKMLVQHFGLMNVQKCIVVWIRQNQTKSNTWIQQIWNGKITYSKYAAGSLAQIYGPLRPHRTDNFTRKFP